MASALAHPLVALSLWTWLRPVRPGPRVLLLAALLTILPDADVLGFALGIPYEHMLGHRGLTHSLPFAAAVAVALGWRFGGGNRRRRFELTLFFFLCVASHGVLDAMTGGGRGVAFLAPFTGQRWFLPLRPLVVSPVNPADFHGARALRILSSEARWVGLPCLGVAALGWAVAARRRRGPAAP